MRIDITWNDVQRVFKRGEVCVQCEYSREHAGPEPGYWCWLLENGEAPEQCPGAYEEAQGRAIEAEEREVDRIREDKLTGDYRDFDARR